MVVKHFYYIPDDCEKIACTKLIELRRLSPLIHGLEMELCFNVEFEGNMSGDEFTKLKWLFTSPFHQGNLSDKPFLNSALGSSLLVEIGPRLNFSTPFSSNVLSICKAIGLTLISRVELSTRYLVAWTMTGLNISAILEEQIINSLHDRMTQCVYPNPIESFDHGIIPEDWFIVDILKNGRSSLEDINKKLGLAFDDWDLDYYTKLFSETLKRNPTSVECFDLAQSNSEHSRHWFFKGKIILNNGEIPHSLFDMIIKTQNFSNKNNVIKFCDNSSAVEGFEVDKLLPSCNFRPSHFMLTQGVVHIAFTAETHNFPTAVAPFSGATTGTGGRIRDVQAVGRGGHCIAGTAGYSVGNLLMPGYDLPWEEPNFHYPDNFASPLNILIEASNGASDYGNKFGEPVICGFTRSFGMNDASGQRREWVKPIMFSGGLGALEDKFIHKKKPEKGMLAIKIGGPVYRIGVGGGAASSIQVQGDNKTELDFGAVQRGDAEMENKLNRVIRACIEDPVNNIICSIHDQGAGGNGNVLKEIVEPAGAIICSKFFNLGDTSVSTLELWGAEYQESNAILTNYRDLEKLSAICHRERCPLDFVGTITGNGKIILTDDPEVNMEKYLVDTFEDTITHPFNMDLSLVLGSMPQKEFYLDDAPTCLEALKLPDELTILEALSRVFRLVSVCSKRFLVNKVDRSVTGLVAQQQCVGPLHTPLADCAVTALSMFSTVGAATAIGEQPIKGLINAAAGARLSVAESLTNLVFAGISSLKDVKCSGNWMWAAKLPGEGAALYRACEAMCGLMCNLGIAIDGGKDSLSMAARVNETTVKAPGTLVISSYAPCPDISCVATPDIKGPSMGMVSGLLWITLSSHHRLGGSALAQCFKQLGDDCPDVDCPEKLKTAFNITQILLSEKKILAGHDISDGGLITCVLEMAFGGLSGLRLTLDSSNVSPIELLFSEEVGWVLEVSFDDIEYILNKYNNEDISCRVIGEAVGHGVHSKITITNNDGNILLDSELLSLISLWEETSYRLECRQADAVCVTEEYNSLSLRKGPAYKVSFNPEIKPIPKKYLTEAPRVAVIREEGTNGDREMAASLYMAGFEVWDIVMQDILDSKLTIDRFCGIVFPGGFSYADVLGSAKGWAACLLYNENIRNQFNSFLMRSDTFSLGVCNGCQLMCLLGWVGFPMSSDLRPNVILDHNLSKRFECRFSSVLIEKSPSIFFNGMEESVLGIWSAHGEGRFTFADENVRTALENKNCFSLKYTDDDGVPTERYPLNPNGSKGGIAGICSSDGRHLAMMPHPERCSLMWQWPYVPPNLKHLTVSPWLRMFQNAFVWAQENTL
ncbi:hypothetical protein AAG570_012912 [Ranatra chinensis]|uniref:Phosphoribosylformylglycinamidine synthase n=1 Tax=Ranatra chinensis TaxID=642074 RepID=A0ABD0Z1G3_9HEMI